MLFVEKVSENAPNYTHQWIYGPDEPLAGKWHPLRIIESFKNPVTELAANIPELTHLVCSAGQAFRVDPGSVNMGFLTLTG